MKKTAVSNNQIAQGKVAAIATIRTIEDLDLNVSILSFDK